MSGLNEVIQIRPRNVRLEAAVIESCARACYDCARAVTEYADACLQSENVMDELGQLQQDLDLADLCGATARLLTNEHPDLAAIRRRLEITVSAMRVFAEKYRTRTEDPVNGKRCAEACTRCWQTCNDLLGQLGSPI